MAAAASFARRASTFRSSFRSSIPRSSIPRSSPSQPRTQLPPPPIPSRFSTSPCPSSLRRESLALFTMLPVHSAIAAARLVSKIPSEPWSCVESKVVSLDMLLPYAGCRVLMACRASLNCGCPNMLLLTVKHEHLGSSSSSVSKCTVHLDSADMLLPCVGCRCLMACRASLNCGCPSMLLLAVKHEHLGSSSSSVPKCMVHHILQADL